MGEEAGELDSFVRFLVMRLLNSLKGKALNYVRDGRDDSQVRRIFFVSFQFAHPFLQQVTERFLIFFCQLCNC